MEHQSLFLMPVWRALGKARWVLHARRLPKAIAIAVAVVALVVGMFIMPWGFWLHSPWRHGTGPPQRRFPGHGPRYRGRGFCPTRTIT